MSANPLSRKAAPVPPARKSAPTAQASTQQESAPARQSPEAIDKESKWFESMGKLGGKTETVGLGGSDLTDAPIFEFRGVPKVTLANTKMWAMNAMKYLIRLNSLTKGAHFGQSWGDVDTMKHHYGIEW